VAVKLESIKARHPQLLYESKLYKILQGGVGIPHIRYVNAVLYWNVREVKLRTVALLAHITVIRLKDTKFQRNSQRKPSRNDGFPATTSIKTRSPSHLRTVSLVITA